MHNPGDKKGDALKADCCEKPTCGHGYCFNAMAEKGLTCPDNSQGRSNCDGHWPFPGHHPSDKMAAIKAKSDEEIKKGCCQTGCYQMMKSKSLKCPVGYEGRGRHDMHYPFGNDDWTKKTNKEITDGCCQKVNKC